MTAYQVAQEAGQSAVRATVLDAATHLLVSEGATALTVRRISAQMGCSTKVIYTMFGGKDGLIEALWLEGFARFERCLLEVPMRGDPLEHVLDLGQAYRAYAIAEPEYYKVMFQGAIPGFEASAQAKIEARASFDITVAAVADCLRAGRLAGGEPREIADLLWMAVHGAVSLEISGYFGAAEASSRYDKLCVSVITPFLPPHERIHPWPPPSGADSPL